jgi:hypothetical protein
MYIDHLVLLTVQLNFDESISCGKRITKMMFSLMPIHCMDSMFIMENEEIFFQGQQMPF